jgi:hypothetical protein
MAFVDRSVLESVGGTLSAITVSVSARPSRRPRRRAGMALWQLAGELVPSLSLCHPRPSQGGDHRLDQALQRRQAALQPRLSTADRAGAQLLSPAVASRIAKCPASGGKPTDRHFAKQVTPKPICTTQGTSVRIVLGSYLWLFETGDGRRTLDLVAGFVARLAATH